MAFQFIGSTIAEFRRRNTILFYAAVAHLLLLVCIIAVLPFDPRTVSGISVWIKPAKFASTGAIYLLTIGWLLDYLSLPRPRKIRINWVIAISMVVENVLISGQAARGVRSHFNLSSYFNAGVFALMGVMITLNAIAGAWITIQFWKTRPVIAEPYLWGIRFGLLIFLLASLQGFTMSAHLGHSIGVRDGGPGLPFLNWSVKGGDLRVAHFIGLHALQVLPLAGYWLSRLNDQARDRRRVYCIWALGIAYGGFTLLLFVRALTGHPFIAPSL
jgi:hypothetical protein